MSRPLHPSDVNIENVSTAAFEIVGIDVREWHPERDGKGKATQVWMLVHVATFPAPFVFRAKGPDTIGQLIAALQRHRKSVWPDAEEYVP